MFLGHLREYRNPQLIFRPKT